MKKLLTLLIALALGSTTYADPGVTDTSVKIGMIADLTGPVAYVGQDLVAGVRLYLDHVNEQGGLYGRKIDLVVEDDGYKPPRTIAAFRKLADRDGVFCFAGNLGSSTTLATLPIVRRSKTPVLAPGTFTSRLSSPPNRYVFPVDPNYKVQSWLMANYIVNIEKAAAPSFGIVYQDDDFGRDGLEGLVEAAAHYGIEIVAAEGYKRGAIDLSTQVLNLKQANPTHVILWTTPREAAVVLKEADRAEFHPQFVAATTTSDVKVIELAGKAAEGLVGTMTFDFHSDNAYSALLVDLHDRLDPDHRISVFYRFGYSIGEVLVEGLRRTGRDLTREGLVEAMETFDRWTGWTGPPLSYGPNNRGGRNSAAYMVKANMETGDFDKMTDWIPIEIPVKLADNGE